MASQRPPAKPSRTSSTPQPCAPADRSPAACCCDAVAPGVLLPGLDHRLELCVVQITQESMPGVLYSVFAGSQSAMRHQASARSRRRTAGLPDAHLGGCHHQAARDLSRYGAPSYSTARRRWARDQLDVLRQSVGERDPHAASTASNTAAIRSFAVCRNWISKRHLRLDATPAAAEPPGRAIAMSFIALTTACWARTTLEGGAHAVLALLHRDRRQLGVAGLQIGCHRCDRPHSATASNSATQQPPFNRWAGYNGCRRYALSRACLVAQPAGIRLPLAALPVSALQGRLWFGPELRAPSPTFDRHVLSDADQLGLALPGLTVSRPAATRRDLLGNRLLGDALPRRQLRMLSQRPSSGAAIGVSGDMMSGVSGVSGQFRTPFNWRPPGPASGRGGWGSRKDPPGYAPRTR